MSQSRPSRCSALLTCALLVLVAVPVVLTWREWRQEKWDRELVRAVQSRNLPLVTVLLQQGANPNTRVDEKTPLSLWKILCDRGCRQKPEQGDTVLLDLVNSDTDMVDWEDLVSVLLNSGADENIGDHFKRTPLMYAIQEGRSGSEYRLLEAHANVDAQDVHGDTALIKASLREREFTHPSTEELTILLDYHPDLNKKNFSGQTALALAKWAHEAETVRLLKQAGATE